MERALSHLSKARYEGLYGAPPSGAYHSNEFYVPSIEFIQGGVIQHQKSLFSARQPCCLLLQRLRVCLLSLQQAGKGIMNQPFTLGLTQSSFHAGDCPLGNNRKLNAILVITLVGCVLGSSCLYYLTFLLI